MERKREILSFDDIVFENRNQDYGAYVIRKKYNLLVIKSMVTGILLVSAMVVIPFLTLYKKPYSFQAGGGGRYIAVNMENIEPPPLDITLPPEILPPPAPAQPQAKYVAPEIVDTVLKKELMLPTIEEAKDVENSDAESLLQAVGSGGDELFGEVGGNAPYDFFILEVPPKFKGGNLDTFREWLQKRVIYPYEAQEKGIEGKVYLTFIVERDGSVTNVNVVKGVHKLLDEEAKRAIESSPPWSPGLQKGRPVRVRFSIYLNFSL